MSYADDVVARYERERATVDVIEPRTVMERVALIEKACASELGFAIRGVASWEREWLLDWRGLDFLPPRQMAALEAIEEQVFGGGAMFHGKHHDW